MVDGQSSAQNTVELARVLKDGRAAKGWTLREAAAKTKISNGYLSLIEQGEVKSPSPRYLMALAEQYGVPFERLMALAGHPSGPTPISAAQAPTSLSGRADGTGEARDRADRPAAGAVEVGPSVVRVPEPGEGGGWASVEPVIGADLETTAALRSVSAQSEPVRYPVRGHGSQPGDAAERQQLAALVVEDLNALSTADIAQVRAFIAGLRAARLS